MDPTAPSDDDIWLLPVTIVARDRVWLRADLALVDGAVGTAVLCHPHPQYGGDRFNVVIDALFRALPEAGITTVRFDFRSGAGIGDDLELPRRDATGAVDESINQHPDLPTFVIGYSFGAAVVLGLHDIRVAATVAIAPPLAVLQEEVAPSVPTLVLVPEHDQYAPPDVVRPLVETWPAATMDVIDSADHFLVDHGAAVAARTTTWLRGHTAR